MRRLALSVAVLYDMDLMPAEEGLVLTAPTETLVEGALVRDVVESAAKRGETESGQRAALADWLSARAAVGGSRDTGVLHALGLPVRHCVNPGGEWARELVPGGALTLGFGWGPAHRPLPAGVLTHAGVDGGAAWSQARSQLEHIGELAAVRDRRHIQGALVPISGADVVTLLGAASLRRELVAGEGDGLVALIVPLRTRGWRATAISDPAYGPALAAAMSPEERGFERPLLVTAEEISEVRPGGDPSRAIRGDRERRYA
jgi:hypothetical protein